MAQFAAVFWGTVLVGCKMVTVYSKIPLSSFDDHSATVQMVSTLEHTLSFTWSLPLYGVDPRPPAMLIPRPPPSLEKDISSWNKRQKAIVILCEWPIGKEKNQTEFHSFVFIKTYQSLPSCWKVGWLFFFLTGRLGKTMGYRESFHHPHYFPWLFPWPFPNFSHNFAMTFSPKGSIFREKREQT